MIETTGWRYAVIPIFIGCALIAVLVLCLIRDRPADLGLAPVGEVFVPAAVSSPQPKMGFNAPFVALREASSNSTFWILASTFFICGLSTNGLVQTHFISLCGDYGMTALPAASVLAMMGAFDFVGTIASGWLSDRRLTAKFSPYAGTFQSSSANPSFIDTCQWATESASI